MYDSGDRCYLEQDLESLKEIRALYLDSALKSKSKSRAKEMMRGVRDKDRQIAWVEGKLRELGSDCDQSGGDRFQETISPNKKPVDFPRGNSEESSQGISPNKKGRGKNNLPVFGSLVPVVQKKRDKQGRIVEYPRVEGERVPRELAFDFPRQFNWQYCYSVQDEDGCWHTKKISVSPERVWSVRSAIASDRPVNEILSVIRERGFY
jgi:hypothetical protein